MAIYEKHTDLLITLCWKAQPFTFLAQIWNTVLQGSFVGSGNRFEMCIKIQNELHLAISDKGQR